MKTQLRACKGMLVVACTCVLTGCGGGGNGTSASNNAPTNPTAVNQAPISTQALFPVYTGTANQQDFGGTPYIDDPDHFDTFTVSTSSMPTTGSVSVSGTKFIYKAGSTETNANDSFNYTVTDSANHSINGKALVREYGASNLDACTQVSTVDTTGKFVSRNNAGKCAIFGQAITRYDSSDNPITVNYIVMRPSDGSDPKAVVFMIGGGDLNMKITGTTSTGTITTTGGNYVVRSGQLMADQGYLVIAMDRPTDVDASASVATDPIADVDAYRISVDQAIDILAVTHQVNGDHLPLYLDGTSRGTISVFANNHIANGIALSSPLTVDGTTGHYPIGATGVNRLQLAYVQRPTYVEWHDSDLCSFTPPASSQQLENNLANIIPTIPVTYNIESGGVRVTTDTTLSNGNVVKMNPCGAFDYHGFMGIEPTAMGDNASAFDTMYTNSFGAGNHIPDAAFASYTTSPGTDIQIALNSLTRDIDNDILSYSLSHTKTSLGGTVSLNGNTVTYTPPAGITNTTDAFVYVVKDSNGGVNAAVVSIKIGS